MEKVNWIRMQHAAVLLINSALSIKVIAASVEFDNPYNFSTAFKRIIGSAPTQVMNAC
jgi:AraC-like DNA-binding protein